MITSVAGKSGWKGFPRSRLGHCSCPRNYTHVAAKPLSGYYSRIVNTYPALIKLSSSFRDEDFVSRILIILTTVIISW